ncbi:MAG: GTP 3',8-cyclase MoaA [Vulcanimicrobiota bacterium]
MSRPLKNLRLSVTDRCNLRCRYCMPEEQYKWLRRSLILDFEELTRLVRIFQMLGVANLRITGGEPLVRRDLPVLVSQLSALSLKDLALTTNGVLLAQQKEALFAAGLDRVTVSLDAVDPKLFAQIAQRDDLERVLEGLHSVAHTPGLKIDSVLMKGINEHQMVPLLELAEQLGAQLRFIEYMDVGGATQWSSDLVFSHREILQSLQTRYGRLQELPGRGSAPAQCYRLPSGQTFGIIASTTRPFCRSCDRARVTADGQLLTCLYSRVGTDLRAWIRSELTDQEIAERLARLWQGREDRGAEQRLQLRRRGPLANAEELQENVHLEMHTRGG